VTSTPVPAEFAPYLPRALADVRVPAYVIARDGRISWLNGAARAIVGDAVGRPFTDVVELDPPVARRIFERRLGGHDLQDISVSLSGTRVDVSAVPLGDDHHVVGMFGLAVPERRRCAPRPEHSPLTPRQHELLQHLADGESTTMIAERLFLSRQTVRNHVQEILRRLGVHSRLAAIAIARRDGLLD
jgi:DNA-binding CsgD family transcriptional regulator